MIFSFVVIVGRPDISVVGKIFYASYAAAGFTFLGYAAVVAANGTRSIAETLTASLLILLDLAAFLVWNSNINYVSDVMCRTRRLAPAPRGRSDVPADGVDPHPGLQRAARAADRDDQGGRGDRLPGLRDHRHRQQHPGSGDLRPGRGVLPRTRADQVRPRRAVAGLQGRRVQPGAPAATPTHAPRSSAWSTPTTSSSRTTCARPSAYFSDQRVGFIQTFEGNRDYEGSNYYTGVRRLVPGLLPGGHVVAERARHRAVRRHDGSLPSQCARGASAAGTSGASARTPRPRCACSRPAGRGCTSRAASAGASCRPASPG